MAQKTTTEAEVKPETPEATAELTPAARHEMASKLVDRFAMWGGVAGLVPVPVVDVAAVAGIQVQMLRRLSQIYNVPFSENSGKAVIAALAGTMIPATSGIGAASMLKSIPILGTIASGFVMPALAAGATFAIGKAFVQHFESGGYAARLQPAGLSRIHQGRRKRSGIRARARRLLRPRRHGGRSARHDGERQPTLDLHGLYQTGGQPRLRNRRLFQ